MLEHEKINYVEFPAHDLEATKAFFSNCFGWEFTDYGPDYTSFSDQGLNGGFFRSELFARAERGSALVVFYSRDLRATEKKVIDEGGTIVQEIFSFPGGHRFHFTEPSGNEFAIWSDQDVD